MAFLEHKIMQITELVLLLQTEVKKKSLLLNLTMIHILKIFHTQKFA